ELACEQPRIRGNGRWDAARTFSKSEEVSAAAAGVSQKLVEGGNGVEAALHRNIEHFLRRKLDRLQLHQPTGKLGRQIRRVCLGDPDVFDHAGRKQVERYNAFLRLGGRNQGPVQLSRTVAFSQPA